MVGQYIKRSWIFIRKIKTAERKGRADMLLNDLNSKEAQQNTNCSSSDSGLFKVEQQCWQSE